MFCYAAPDWSIASLVLFLWFHLEADSIFALTDKMTKKLNCHQETTGTQVFMPQNSLPAPSLHEQSFSLTNKWCSGRKRQQKTVSHPLPPINKLQFPHEIESQPINQAALAIRNGSKTTPGFNLRRADGNFRLLRFPNVRTILGLLGQNVRGKFQSS